jgi:acyl carrier protein
MTLDAAFVRDKKLESDLLRLWNTLLNRSDLTIDDDFFECGGDSLLATELLVEIERLTQCKLPPAILFETGTVRRLAEKIGTNLSPQVAVRIGSGNGKRLFHYFHGDFNKGGISVPMLVRLLDPERPLLAIAPHGFDGGPIPGSIEQMATDRLPLVLEAQPRGPYVLGGHCNGALVAFEVARMLVAAGQCVDLVVMIDPLIISVRPSVRLLLFTVDFTNRLTGVADDLRWRSRQRAWRKFVSLDARLRKASIKRRGAMSRLWNMTWPERWDAIERRCGIGDRPAKSSEGSDSLEAEPTMAWDFPIEIRQAYDRALSVYRPLPLAVPVLYFALRYSGRAWRRISPEIELINHPSGDHHSFLRGNFAAAMMNHLRARLDTLDASSR